MTDFVADLARLDPAREWEPWTPAAADPWGPKWAGHLLRRAAFGGTWAEVKAAVRAGPDAAVARVFAGGPGLAEFDDLMDALAPGTTESRYRRAAEDPAGVDIEGWWLHRMVLTPHPLRERMTLFWHNHFATSVAKVRDAGLMRDQNQLLRRHALGKFGPLVQDVSKDPAMLVWLDSNGNVRGRPNENFARELLELFCLGVGNYTEADVREAARAFTGWHTNTIPEAARSYGAPAPKPAFVFNAAQHDDGPKTVLGQSGAWGGADVVRLALGHPACGRHLARRLYAGFVGEAAVPPDALLEPLADRLRKSDYDAADALRVVFRSRHFFSRFAYRQRVKGPVEYLVGLARGLEGKPAGEGAAGSLSAAARDMGQTLFAPPSVKGWDGGPAWLNTATLLARHNTAWRLLQAGNGPQAVRFNPAGLLARHAPGRAPAGQVDALFDLMLQPGPGEIDAQIREKLAAYLGAPGAAPADHRVRETAHAIACLPLFQLA